MSVEMRDRAEPELARDPRIDFGDARLPEMRDAAELELLRLVQCRRRSPRAACR
jgi:hypothetical protein